MGEFEKRIEIIEILLQKAKIIPQSKLMAMKGADFQELLSIVQKMKVLFDEARKEFPWDVLCNVGHPMFQSDEARLRKWFKKYFLGT